MLGAIYTAGSLRKRETPAGTLVLDGGEDDGVVVFDLLHVYGDLRDGFADVVDLRKQYKLHSNQSRYDDIQRFVSWLFAGEDI